MAKKGGNKVDIKNNLFPIKIPREKRVFPKLKRDPLVKKMFGGKSFNIFD